MHCSIRGGYDGVNIVKSVEIRAEGDGGYLTNLSTQLRQFQKDVNATLTELVDKEKSRAQGTNARRGTYNLLISQYKCKMQRENVIVHKYSAINDCRQSSVCKLT